MPAPTPTPTDSDPPTLLAAASASYDVELDRYVTWLLRHASREAVDDGLRELAAAWPTLAVEEIVALGATRAWWTATRLASAPVRGAFAVEVARLADAIETDEDGLLVARAQATVCALDLAGLVTEIDPRALESVVAWAGDELLPALVGPLGRWLDERRAASPSLVAIALELRGDAEFDALCAAIEPWSDRFARVARWVAAACDFVGPSTWRADASIVAGIPAPEPPSDDLWHVLSCDRATRRVIGVLREKPGPAGDALTVAHLAATDPGVQRVLRAWAWMAATSASSGPAVPFRGAIVIAPTDTPPPFVVAPDLGPDGGATVELPPGTTSTRIASAAARVIDLRADGALRAIDLRDTAPGVRLTLAAEGPVEAILLPPGAGAVVDVALPCAPAALVVRGPLRRLSVAWPGQGGEGRRRDELVFARRREVVDGAFFGGAGAPRPRDVAAWVIVGGVLPRDAFGPGVGAPRDLRLVDCAAPDGLDLVGDFDRLDLVGVELPDLAFGSAGLVRISSCLALRRIVGSVHLLALCGGSHVPELRVEGARVISADDLEAASLHALDARRIALAHCNGVGEIHALSGPDCVSLDAGGVAPKLRAAILRARVRQPSSLEIERAMEHGSDASRRALVRWARDARHPGELACALGVLGAAVDVGFASAAAMWAVRGQVAQRAAPGAEPWTWPFPEEVERVGYQADVFLWLRLLAEDEALALREATAFTEGGHSTGAAALLLAATGDVDPPERDALVDLARRTFDRGAGCGKRLDRVPGRIRGRLERVDPGTLGAELARVDLALRALLALADVPGAVRVADAFGRWIAARLPTLEGVRVLGRLAAHGSTASAAALDALSAAAPARGDLAGGVRPARRRRVPMDDVAAHDPAAFRRAIARELLRRPEARRFAP